MNWSMYTADRSTHCKIAAVGFAVALVIVAIGTAAQKLNPGTDIMAAQAPSVIKTDAPVVYSSRDGSVIR
jgi:hypothetical protein